MTAYDDGRVSVHLGDCLDVLRELPDASVDAIVTDPPYGLEFMGKGWDAPWAESDVNADAGMSGTGYTDGGERLPRPSFTGSTNPKCLDCKGTRRGRRDGTAKVAVCLCENGGRFPNHRAVEMRAFQEWCTAWTTECLRVLKPGGHMLAFGGTRTWHRLACAVEDAGFEVRDSIAWLYGSGFPKSLDVSKAIDKLDASEERTARAREFQSWLRKHLTPQQVNAATGTDMGHHLTTHPTQPAVATADLFDRLRPLLPEVPERIEELVAQRTVESENFKRREVVGTARMVDTSRSRLGFAGATYGGDGSSRDVALTAAHTEEAAAWQGWGTALKPAFEPVVVARKPLQGTVAANVMQHGTGALNIDGCRVESGERPVMVRTATEVAASSMSGKSTGATSNGETTTLGRWPTNVVLDDSQAAELDEQSGVSTSPTKVTRGPDRNPSSFGLRSEAETADCYGDTGGASRFFPTFRYEAKAPASERPKVNGTAHPTVKPLDLMRWLVRLVTPPGGTVLEPFAGSGTTVEACIVEGFHCIAIEREADYLPLILQRIHRRRDPVAAIRQTGDDLGLFELDGEPA